MEFFGLTDIGKVRKLNEDSIIFGKLGEKAAYLAVCDGMGGANHGEVASMMAADRIKNNYSVTYRDEFSEANIKNLINATLSLANADIFSKSASDFEFMGMGTTACTAIIKDSGEIVIGNIGDSRAYIIGDEVRQITEDHSLVWDLLKKGEITKEDIGTHPDRNIITRALGAESRIEADIFYDNLKKGETLLICSDGLSGFVDESNILDSCREPIEVAARKLITLANDAGGKDNISVILCRI